MFSPKISRRATLKTLAGTGLYLGTLPLSATAPPTDAMQQRKIPSSGEKLGVVGVGTWQTFDVGSSANDRAPLQEVLRILAERGGNVIDSSPMYGRSEAVTGAVAAATGMQSRFFYATKVWTRGQEAGVRQMEDSMQKMQADPMDLMQIHNLLDWQTHLATLNTWKDQGKIRYTGITHYTSRAFDSMRQIMQEESIDFIQIPYSILSRQAEDVLLPLAQDRGIGVIVNQPYEGGSLFRAVKDQALPPWAGDFHCASWGQFFLKYVLAHPAVTCVIPGTDDPEHMRDNAGAGVGSMPDDNTRQKMVAVIKELMG